MIVEEARDDDEVNFGTFLANYFHAVVIFDVGASRSFVSPTFNALFVIPRCPLSPMLDNKVLIGRSILVGENSMGARSLSLVAPFRLL